jgi:hypothetical protein
MAFLNDPFDADSIFLFAEKKYFGAADLVYFFRTTKTQIHFIRVWQTSFYSHKISSDALPLKSFLSFPNGGLLDTNFLSRFWRELKQYSDYITDLTKHSIHCTNEDIFSNFFITELATKRLYCTSCVNRLFIKFEPNMNKKTLEVWSLWSLADSNTISYYFQWIPEEVLTDILMLI